MGPGEDAADLDIEIARQLGSVIAERGWILLTGGRSAGVMDAASEGARSAGGLTLGILPGKDKAEASTHLDIAVLTNLGEARNALNVLTADIIVGIGMNPGTASEIALAIKAEKEIILLNCPPSGKDFFTALGGASVHIAHTVNQAVQILNDSFKTNQILIEGG